MPSRMIRYVLFLLLIICNYFTIVSQVIIPNKDALKYKMVYELKIPWSDKSDSIFSETYYTLQDSQCRIGKIIEYYPDGKIFRVAYTNNVSDTFSIDSNHIIIFNNPCKNAWLNLQAHKRKNENYFIITESGFWNVVFTPNGTIAEECIDTGLETIRIVYKGNKTLFYKLKDNKIIEEWEYISK